VGEFSSSTLQGRGLYFLHVPKTAGTSVSSMLSQISLERGLSYRGPLLLDDLEGYSGWRTADILSGHLARLPLTENFAYFTIMRDPMQRLYSYYSHVKRDPGHYFHGLVVSEGLSFESWLLDSRTRNLNFNMQTRYLSSFPRIRRAGKERWVVQRRFENASTLRICLGKALKTLDEAIWFGTNNDLSNLQVNLARAYGMKDLHLPTLNTNDSPRNDFTPAEIAAGESLIRLDTVLYQASVAESSTRG